MSGSTPTRSYRSTLRSEQAAATRERVLEAAAACFAENGYGATSLSDIGSRAGVSTETVKVNGPKRALLLGAFEQAFAGVEGEIAIPETDAGRAIVDISDDVEFVRTVSAFIAQANARTSTLWAELLAAARGDAVIATALDGLLERRRADYRSLVGMLIERGIVPGSTDPERAAASLSFLWSPESHQQLVLQSGWSMHHYEGWLADAARRLLTD